MTNVLLWNGRRIAPPRRAVTPTPEDGDYRCRAHQRAEAAHCRHQNDGQTAPLVPALASSQSPRRRATPVHLVHYDDAGERHRHQQQKGHRIHARPVDHEHDDRCREHKQHEGEIQSPHGFLRRAIAVSLFYQLDTGVQRKLEDAPR